MVESKSPFLIAHLSDLHLTPSDDIGRVEVSLPGKNLFGMNKTFEAILKSKEVQESDLILITGDITDVGDRKSWQVFHKILVGSGLDKKTLVIAGNHDVCDMDWKIKLGDFFDTLTRSKQKQNLDRLKFNLKGINQPANYPWKRVVDKKYRRVMIIGLDTNHSGHFYLHDNAIGKIGWSQLTKLENILKKHSNKKDKVNYIPVRIIAMHHSPNIPNNETLIQRGILKKTWIGGNLMGKTKGLFTRWSHQIPKEERRDFRDLCKQYHVRLIVHGHMHEDMNRYVNSVRIIGAPATTQPLKGRGKKKYQFYHYAILGNGGRLEPELVTINI